jgi:hypothetical protein
VSTDTPETRPSYYGGESNPHEPIKVIEYYGLDYHRGSAVAYILRAGLKPTEPEEKELAKAIWFLQRRIDFLKRQKEAARAESAARIGDLTAGDKIRSLREVRAFDKIILCKGEIVTVLDVDHTPGQERVKFQTDDGIGWLSLSDIERLK